MSNVPACTYNGQGCHVTGEICFWWFFVVLCWDTRDPRRRILLHLSVADPTWIEKVVIKLLLGLRSELVEFPLLIVVLLVPWVEGILGFGLHLIVSRSLYHWYCYCFVFGWKTELFYPSQLSIWSTHNCWEISLIIVIQLGSFLIGLIIFLERRDRS